MKPLTLALFGALVTGLFLATGTAEAQATRTAYTGTQTCYATSLGEVTFPDGNIHIRGSTSTCYNETSLPDGVSISQSLGNENLDSTGSGQLWGTLHIETTGGAVLEGVFTGTVTGGTAWTVMAVVQGLGPLNAKVFATSECHVVAPGVSTCNQSGYLLVP